MPEIICPACGCKYDIPVEQLGLDVQCECGKTFEAISNDPEPPPKPEPPKDQPKCAEPIKVVIPQTDASPREADSPIDEYAFINGLLIFWAIVFYCAGGIGIIGGIAEHGKMVYVIGGISGLFCGAFMQVLGFICKMLYEINQRGKQPEESGEEATDDNGQTRTATDKHGRQRTNTDGEADRR